MIRRENINFVASVYAPNPKEVTYWIDLTEGPDGQIIKSYVNNEWVKVNQNENEQQTADIIQLRQDVNNLATTKADKATTLSGYGITDAYTKTEVDGKISSKANSSDVYTKTETDQQINTKVTALVDSAPETLDTLNELAAALGDDANFATTVTTQLAGKANTNHTHTIANVSGLQSALDAKATSEALTSGLAGKANTSHTHTISNITNLQTTLDGKAASNHTHTASQITDLNLNSYITGQGVSRIEVVTELPGTPEESVLYLVVPVNNPV